LSESSRGPGNFLLHCSLPVVLRLILLSGENSPYGLKQLS